MTVWLVDKCIEVALGVLVGSVLLACVSLVLAVIAATWTFIWWVLS